jgi:small-conductance mechanosensitive channel
MDNLEALITQGLSPLAPYPYLQALLVILLFGALAMIVDKLISGVCTRLVANTQSNIDDQLVKILHRPIFTSVAMVGLVIATYRLDFSEGLRNTTIAVLQTVLIIIWITFGLRLSRIVVTAMKRREKSFRFVQHSTEPLIANAIAVFLFLAGVYAILVAWDINVTGLVASAGILGLALSFAAQDTLANLFAGVAILADRPYKIGDFIVIDSGERGQVTKIGLRSTRLLTRDDVEVSIPNGVMGRAKIINEAGGPPRRYRVRVAVGVAYGSDIDKVMEILLAIAEDHAKIFSTPEPRVRFRQFGESSLDFELLCWIERPADKGLVSHELHYEIYKRFSAQGVQIPFPQRDLHIKQMPE